MRDHWPFQLGYLLGSLASSAARAPLIVTLSARASANAQVELRSNMIVLPTFGLFIDRKGCNIQDTSLARYATIALVAKTSSGAMRLAYYALRPRAEHAL